MPTNVQELVDQRVKLIEDSRKYHDEAVADHEALTAEECATFEAMLDQADELEGQIKEELEAQEAAAARAARLEEAEAKLREVRSSREFDKIRRAAITKRDDDGKPVMSRSDAVNRVLQHWTLNGRASCMADSDFAPVFKASECSWDNSAGGLYIPLLNQAPRTMLQAAQSTTATEGGHTTFPGFVENLERALLQFGGMRQTSTILRTATGSALDWPTVDDTSNTGALLSENVQDSEQDVTFGNLTLDAYKYTSKIVRVSVELMQDSAFNMGATLGSLLGERLGRIQNTHATTGTGSSQPNGIVTAGTSGKTAASSTAVTMDEILDLLQSVDPAYRGPGAGWMFNDSTRNTIRQLKSTDSVYHWQPGAQAGDPDVLFNFPVTINQDVASIAASAKTILFGQLDKYLMREVMGITVVRMDERYADFHQVGFVALMRFDGDLLDAGTNPVKYLEQA